MPGSAFGGCSHSHQGKAKNKIAGLRHIPRRAALGPHLHPPPWLVATSSLPVTSLESLQHRFPPCRLQGACSSALTDGTRWPSQTSIPPDTRELVGSELGQQDIPLPPGTVGPGSAGARGCLSLCSPLSPSNLPCCSLNSSMLWLPGDPVPRGSGAPADGAGRCLCSTGHPTGIALPKTRHSRRHGSRSAGHGRNVLLNKPWGVLKVFQHLRPENINQIFFFLSFFFRLCLDLGISCFSPGFCLLGRFV